jgi:transcriptional regulator with XRE-family HTH domain
MAGDHSILSLSGDRASGAPGGGVKGNKAVDPTKRVGAIIAKARKRAGISQGRLADRPDGCQSFVSKIESGDRLVEVREFMWIVRRIGEDPVPLLEHICRNDDFRDLEQPPPPKPREPTRYDVEPYDPADEVPDDDEAELGHLTLGSGGAP